MGITRSFLDLVFSNNHARYFRGKNILTLGVIHPFLSLKDYKYYSSIGIELSRDKTKFAHSLFVESLGCKSLQSLDISTYQGADIIADLNFEIPPHLRSSFDLVLDLGTLEHLFDVPKSLANIFYMLSEGGVYYSGVVCNNWIDHGFYQFSPTFFVDFARHNEKSIKLIDLILTAPYQGMQWRLFDLDPLSKNVLFSSSYKLGVIGVLKKLDNAAFRFDVVQSKYIKLFEESSSPERSRKIPWFGISALCKRLVLYLLTSPLLPLSSKLALVDLLKLLRPKLSKFTSIF